MLDVDMKKFSSARECRIKIRRNVNKSINSNEEEDETIEIDS
jgi:hypothetical protein